MKKLLISCLSLCICITAGCLHFSRGYSQKQKTETYEVAATKKVPLTFSVILYPDGPCGMAASNVDQLAEKIKKSLEETGLFSTVQLLRGWNKSDDYHVTFEFHRSCGPDALTFWYFVTCYSLTIIPTGEDYYFDGAATVYLRNEEIASFGKTEEMTCLYWLPCIIVYPFANGFFAWDNVEDKIINGLVNDFTKEHMERFANKE